MSTSYPHSAHARVLILFDRYVISLVKTKRSDKRTKDEGDEKTKKSNKNDEKNVEKNVSKLVKTIIEQKKNGEKLKLEKVMQSRL